MTVAGLAMVVTVAMLVIMIMIMVMVMVMVMIVVAFLMAGPLGHLAHVHRTVAEFRGKQCAVPRGYGRFQGIAGLGLLEHRRELLGRRMAKRGIAAYGLEQVDGV